MKKGESMSNLVEITVFHWTFPDMCYLVLESRETSCRSYFPTSMHWQFFSGSCDLWFDGYHPVSTNQTTTFREWNKLVAKC